MDERLPKKMQEGKFQALKERGKHGQRVVAEHLQSIGYRVLHLDYAHAVDQSTNVPHWRDLPKVPDGLAKSESVTFFFEVKTKSWFNPIVNVRNYREYLELAEDFFPVVIYFYILDTQQLYAHTVKRRGYPESQQWDGNRTYDLRKFVKEVTNFAREVL